MLNHLLFFIIVAILVFSSKPVKAAQNAQSFTLSGTLLKADNSEALLDSNVKIKLSVLDPSKNCLLYEEEQTVNTSATNGYYSIQVGSYNSGTTYRTGSDSGNSMSAVYQNTSSITATNAPNQICSGSHYTPSARDIRYIRLTVTPSSTNQADVLSPDIEMGSVPQAMVAETLQGYDPGQFLILGNGDLSQANVQNVFSSGNTTKLIDLINGNSNQYAKGAGNNTVPLPSVSGSPTSLQAGQVWYDSGSNAIKFYNGSSAQTLGISGAGITSLTAGTGLNAGAGPGGTLNTSGTLNVDVGTTANKIVQMDGSGKLPAVDGSQLTYLNGSAISSGTIGGSTAINSSGTISSGNITSSGNIIAQNISATGSNFSSVTLTNGSSQTMVLQPPSSITGTPTFTLPGTVGGANQVLTTDGAGNLSWSSLSGGTVTSVTSANADISVAGTSAPVLTLNSGSGPNQIVKLDGSSQLPAVSGANLTNLPVANLSGVVSVAKGGTGSSTVLGGNRVMVSNGGAIVEAAAITANKVLVSDANGIPTHSTVSNAELGYLSLVTSPIQAQINNKQAASSELSAISSLALTGIVQRTGGGSYTALGTSAPLGISGANIIISQATTSTDGFLSSSDWNTFNNKQSALGYTPVNKAGDSITGVLGMTGIAAPAVSPAGEGKIYFDSAQNKFLISQNGEAYAPIGIAGSGVTSFNGRTGAISPATNDYSFAQISGKPTTLSGYGIADSVQNTGTDTNTNITSMSAGLDANKPTAGTAGRIYMATDSQKIYRDDGFNWILIASAGGSGGTVTSVTSANADISVAGTSTPVLTLNTGTGPNQIVKLDGSSQLPAVSGANLTNLPVATTSATGVVQLATSGQSTANLAVQANDSRLSDSRAPTGTASGDLSGNYPNPTVAKIKGQSISTTGSFVGQVLRYEGANVWAPNFISMFDLRSTVTGTQAFSGVGCLSNQTLTWTSATDNLSCTNIAISSGQVSGLGTAATLNVGTGANNIVQLDGSSKLPAVDGSALTNLNASNISSGTIDVARLPASVLQSSSAIDGLILNKMTGDPSVSANTGRVYYKGGDGIDSYTKLLLHGDGSGTSLVDSSNFNRAISISGGVTQSTVQSKFGGSSMFFDVNINNKITVTNSSDFNFGALSFTIDWYIYPTTTSAGYIFQRQQQNSGTSTGRFVIMYNNGGIYANIQSDADSDVGGQWAITNNASQLLGTIGINAWSHVAIIRNATTIKTYINGTESSSISVNSTSLRDGIGDVIITGSQSGGGLDPFIGYIDEFRISKGVARWTSNFTPPSVPYGNSAVYFKDETGTVTPLSGGSGGSTTSSIWGQSGSTINYTSGNVGVGTSTPTAKLHLGAGSTSANSAPLKLTSGALMSTPEDGAMEYNGTDFYLTTGSTRRAISSGSTVGVIDSITTINNSSGSISMNPSSGNSVLVSGGTASTSSSTGTLVVTGGAGISGTLNAGGNIFSGGSITATTALYSPFIYGGNTASGNLTIDSTSNATKGNIVLASSGGNVGVGTTAPKTTLDINGAMRLAKNSAEPFACDADHDGAIALTSGYTTCVCNGGASAWVRSSDGNSSCLWLGVNGLTQSTAGTSCKTIKNNYPSSNDGVYWIDPNGGSTGDAFQAYCDMTTDNGGWTLIGTYPKNQSPIAQWTDYNTVAVTTPNDPSSNWLYQGSLTAFAGGDVREQISCDNNGCLNVYGLAKSENDLALIRQSWGYNSKSTSYSNIPSCTTNYLGGSNNIAGCSPYSGATSNTILGWAVDLNQGGHANSHCWAGRGSGSGATGSSLCAGDPNGTQWALLWFR